MKPRRIYVYSKEFEEFKTKIAKMDVFEIGLNYYDLIPDGDRDYMDMFYDELDRVGAIKCRKIKLCESNAFNICVSYNSPRDLVPNAMDNFNICYSDALEFVRDEYLRYSFSEFTFKILCEYCEIKRDIYDIRDPETVKEMFFADMEETRQDKAWFTFFGDMEIVKTKRGIIWRGLC